MAKKDEYIMRSCGHKTTDAGLSAHLAKCPAMQKNIHSVFHKIFPPQGLPRTMAKKKKKPKEK